MRRLAVDISTFSRMRELNYVYVDKTEHMYNMITQGQRYFLSRPRRFGKSLLISTFYEILTGNRALFDDLWIAQSDYDWKVHGVINLDFSQLTTHNLTTLRNDLQDILLTIAQHHNLSLEYHENQISILFRKLVQALYDKYGRVAILVDEYDSPILKTLENQALAQEIRDEIQHFFTLIKSFDKYVSFVFITGVSSFAKAGLFSGINNVQMITLRESYATICGYTDQEIDTYFKEHITAWARKENISYEHLREQIKAWYNGYKFGYHVPSVYNPFSVMNAIDNKDFKNYWFQSGAPTFLINILKKEYRSFDPDNLSASEDFLGVFDVGATPLLSLMFQAGYLTIVDYDEMSKRYKLNYPNQEVAVSFQKYLLEVFAHIDAHTAQQLSLDLLRAFNNKNVEQVVIILKQLFAHIPYQIHISQESYYHSLFTMICAIAGIKSHAEYSTSHGRIDLILEFPRLLYVIEIKFNDPAEKAMEQIEQRKYYEKFIMLHKHIVLLGLAFKRKPTIFDISYVVKEL